MASQFLDSMDWKMSCPVGDTTSAKVMKTKLSYSSPFAEHLESCKHVVYDFTLGVPFATSSSFKDAF
jgi:hypothetical protein